MSLGVLLVVVDAMSDNEASVYGYDFENVFGEGVLPLVDLLTQDELHRFMLGDRATEITREMIEATVNGPRTALPDMHWRAISG